jgi:hypothetical protein
LCTKVLSISRQSLGWSFINANGLRAEVIRRHTRKKKKDYGEMFFKRFLSEKTEREMKERKKEREKERKKK